MSCCARVVVDEGHARAGRTRNALRADAGRLMVIVVVCTGGVVVGVGGVVALARVVGVLLLPPLSTAAAGSRRARSEVRENVDSVAHDGLLYSTMIRPMEVGVVFLHVIVEAADARHGERARLSSSAPAG